MIIAVRGDGGTQNIRVLVNGADGGNQKHQELNVVMRCLAGIEQVIPIIIGERPVDMLAGTVDTGKRFFVHECGQPVLFGDGFERVHHQLVVINGQIGFFINRRDFKLAGRHFVVSGLRRNAQFKKFFFDVMHIGRYSFFNAAEILIFQFLSLGGRSADNGSAAQHQILTFEKIIHINQKVFLFGTKIGIYFFDIFDAQHLQHIDGAVAQCADGTQQRCLFVQRLSVVGNKDARNAKGGGNTVSFDERR